MYNQIEFDSEVMKKIEKDNIALNNAANADEGFSEMSFFEASFLGTMIKKAAPTKVVEVGVAAGGTSLIIYKTLETIGKECQMISVDISEKYYRNHSKKTGFLLDEMKSRTNKSCVNHKFLLGKSSAEAVSDREIGKGIDLLILDTTHVLPGELLDFLVWLPYLKENATVILHDLSANYELGGNQKAVSSTKLLFDLIVADKYLMKDKNRVMGYPNIGALVLNAESKMAVRDLFSALTQPWEYMLNGSQVEIYRRELQKNYTEEYIDIFDTAVGLSEWLLGRPKVKEKKSFRWKVKRAIRVLVYGR